MAAREKALLGKAGLVRPRQQSTNRGFGRSGCHLVQRPSAASAAVPYVAPRRQPQEGRCPASLVSRWSNVKNQKNQKYQTGSNKTKEEEPVASAGALSLRREPKGPEDYRSISSSSGVASPATDMGVLSIMGLGEGRGVNRCFCFRRSASFSWSHCSAILPQSMAAWLLDLGRERQTG